MAEPFILKDNLSHVRVAGVCCGAGSELSYPQVLGSPRTLTSAVLPETSGLHAALVADSRYRVSVCAFAYDLHTQYL